MPATMRLVFGPQLTLLFLSDAKEYSPGGRGPMALAARQSGSGLFLQASLPEMAQAVGLPFRCGASATMKRRPVSIVYPRRKLFDESGALRTASSNGVEISAPRSLSS